MRMFSKVRRDPRAGLGLAGRYMLSDRQEYPCTAIDGSVTGMAIAGPVAGKIGERIVVYIDTLGRFEGNVVRLVPEGFAIQFVTKARGADAIARLAFKQLVVEDRVERQRDRRS